jgi:two-component SAPR family response regulator
MAVMKVPDPAMRKLQELQALLEEEKGRTVTIGEVVEILLAERENHGAHARQA